MSSVDQSGQNGPPIRKSAASWYRLLYEIVVRMPERFELHDLDAHFDTLRRAYPNNKNIPAKVRQLLQHFRNDGVIAFLGSGVYRRLIARPKPSTKIDFSDTAEFTSAAQRARVALEVWAKLNLSCHNCGSPTLVALPPNAPVADLRCLACDMEYQVKAKNGRFGAIIVGAAYSPLHKRAVEKNIPDFVLIEYDVVRECVVFVSVIRGHEITEDRVVPRKALPDTARRAGWTGSNIKIDGLLQIPLVEPAFRT